MNHFLQAAAAAPAHGGLAADHLPRFLPLQLFDEIDCGLIVCDDQGTLQFANHAARQELGAGTLLARAGNTVRLAPGVRGGLDVALAQAANRGRRTLVQLHRGGDNRLLVSVLPLHLPGIDSPLVLMMLGRRRLCSELGLEMLAGSYGLTLAERRVLSGLVRNATPQQIAVDHAVKLSTVRTQISSIRAKLGTRNIDGLLLRAAEMPPVSSALRMASGDALASPRVEPRELAAAA